MAKKDLDVKVNIIIAPSELRLERIAKRDAGTEQSINRYVHVWKQPIITDVPTSWNAPCTKMIFKPKTNARGEPFGSGMCFAKKGKKGVKSFIIVSSVNKPIPFITPTINRNQAKDVLKQVAMQVLDYHSSEHRSWDVKLKVNWQSLFRQ